jgi:ATP-dependent RNA helicase DeaD
VAAIDIAAALARMSRGGLPLLLVKGQDAAVGHAGALDRPSNPPSNRSGDRSSDHGSDRSAERTARRSVALHDSNPAMPWGTEPGGDTREGSAKPARSRPGSTGFQTFRVQVGEAHGAKPGHLMGAIANEAGLEARQIGRIRVFEQHSLVELPEALPARVIKHLSKVRVAGQMLRIHPTEAMPPRGPRTSASAPAAWAERPARPGTSRSGPSPRPRKNTRPRSSD